MALMAQGALAPLRLTTVDGSEAVGPLLAVVRESFPEIPSDSPSRLSYRSRSPNLSPAVVSVWPLHRPFAPTRATTTLLSPRQSHYSCALSSPPRAISLFPNSPIESIRVQQRKEHQRSTKALPHRNRQRQYRTRSLHLFAAAPTQTWGP